MDIWMRLEDRTRAARERAAQLSDDDGQRASHNVEELRKVQAHIEELIEAEKARGRAQGWSWD
jgi:hypothetical protein